MFFFQFYGQAIVIDDPGAVAGIKHSFRCVQAHLVTTLGYSPLAGSVGLLFGLGGVVLTLLTMPDAEAPFVDLVTSVEGLLGVAIVFVALSGLFTGLMAACSVAFYREIRVPTPG